MQIADAAWHNVDTMTIQNCWCKAGEMDLASSRTTQPLVPISSLIHNPAPETDPVVCTEKQVEAALDNLVTTEALQMKNWVDIELLFNPVGKSHVLTETLDQEIYQAVMDSIAAHENIEINGGDNVDINDTPIEPCPTQCHVLKAVSTVSRYAKDLNHPIACKFKALLGSFNRQLRLEETKSMKETALTDFFQRL